MERTEKLCCFGGDLMAIGNKKVTPGVHLTYKINNNLVAITMSSFTLQDPSTRQMYGQPEGLTYLGAMVREENQVAYMPDCWRTDSGKRIGHLALPKSEIQSLPTEGIEMPDFWWYQLLNADLYGSLFEGYGQAVADRFIELGVSNMDQQAIIQKLQKEFNIK